MLIIDAQTKKKIIKIVHKFVKILSIALIQNKFYWNEDKIYYIELKV